MYPGERAGESILEVLKPREREILSLLAQHKTNQEISEQLILSLNTVKWYTRQIYQKLGVENRRQAVGLAQKEGLLGTPRVAAKPRHNLPSPLTPFVGRQTELETLTRLITDPACRLLTLLGPGGFGKTRLALQLGRNLVEQKTPEFRDGVFFFPLDSLDRLESILHVFLHQVNLPLDPKVDLKAELLDYLRDKSLLCILDSFEHLVGDDSAQLLTEMLEAVPGLKFLVTSRVRLGIQGEQLFPVLGLEVIQGKAGPIDEDQLEAARGLSSVQLFRENARHALPSFELNNENLLPVVQICQLLQGIPLGIVLASAWVRVLDPRQIYAEIQASLDFLESGWRDLPERQHSLRAVLEASWELLSPMEKEAVEKLSLFRESFTGRVAGEAFGISLQALTVLLDKSWLQRLSDGRFTLHEQMRQFAGEQLQQDRAAWEVVNARFSEYYRDFLSQLEGAWRGVQPQEAVASIEPEVRNIEAAWQWLVERGEWPSVSRALHSLCSYYDACGNFQGGERASEKVVQKLVEQEIRAGPLDLERQLLTARARIWQGHFSRDWETAQSLMAKSQATYDRLAQEGRDTRQGQAFLHEELGGLYSFSERSRAREHFEQALNLYLDLEDEPGVARMYILLGGVDWSVGAFEAARTKMKQSLELQLNLGDRRGMVLSLNDLGLLSRHLGNFQEAEQYQRESLALAEELGFPLDIVFLTGNTAFLLVFLGKPDQAYVRAIESLELLDQLGFSHAYQANSCNAAAFANLHLGAYDRVYAYAHQGIELGARFHSDQDAGLGYFISAGAHLADGHLEIADEQFRESARILRQSRQNFAGITPAGQAMLALQREQADRAWNFLLEAMQQTLSVRSFIPAIHVLPAAAAWYVSRERIDQGVKLYALARRNPFVRNSRWFQQLVGQKVDQAAEALSPDQQVRLISQGQSMDFWETLEQIRGDVQAGG